MLWFAIASLFPAALLALACLFGGAFPLLGLLSITVWVFLLDKLSRAAPHSDQSGRALCYALAVVHFSLLPLGVWALADGAHLGRMDKLFVFVGLGLFFGQISNPNAHELIHASARFPRRLGAAIYISLLHGHHVSAHLRVHHIHAATANDPNSAALGESFWAFAWRAMRGEFIAGFRADQRHRARAQTPNSALSHPYVAYLAGGLAAVLVAVVMAGVAGICALIAIATYAQLQLLLSDYVQHYGLRRALRDNGKVEPVGPQHSWNAPNWYSSAMMLNAPRHSDHHMRPARSFPALDLTQAMPILPRSLPVMAVVALIPPLWRHIMDRRAQVWQNPAQPSGT